MRRTSALDRGKVPVLRFDGKPQSRGTLAVNMDKLIGTRMLVQANSGGGKSRFIRSLCEQAMEYAHAQVLVLDTEGEFGTLREKFPFILCGKDQDLPVHPKLAKALCRQLMSAGAHAVVSLFDLKVHERREFVKLFLEELMALPKAMWRPLLLVLDEAHNYAPQQGESMATEAVVTLCTQGRKRGYCAILATQRMSKLHKDATAELLNRAIGRTGQDLDMRRAADELGMGKDEMLSLRSLLPGTFHVFGPAFSDGIGVTLVQSGDVVTTHPEAGSIGTFTPTSNRSVAKMLEKIGDIPKLAAADEDKLARTERELRDTRAKLSEAVKDIAKARHEARVIDASADQINAAMKSAHDAAILLCLSSLQRVTADLAMQVPDKSLPVPLIAKTARFLDGTGRVSQIVDNTKSPLVPHNIKTSPVRQVVAGEFGDPAFKPNGPQHAIIDAIHMFEQLGVPTPRRAHVASWCGVTASSRGFEANVQTLRKHGFVSTQVDGALQLTEEGRGHSMMVEGTMNRTLDELHKRWIETLKPKHSQMLRWLLDNNTGTIYQDALAAGTGQNVAARGFEANLQALVGLGLVRKLPNRVLKLTDLLFPPGLR